MMEAKPTKLPGCFELWPQIREDQRGRFVKTFHRDVFDQHGLETHFAEEYYSVSRKSVLRGLHFQVPPMEHVKMVYCVRGVVFDAVVDLRIGSPTYGQHAAFRLSADNGNIIYIPPGLAHGFYVLDDLAVMLYKVSSVHAPDHDTGILWNSLDIPWPDPSPNISERDQQFPSLADFTSPFRFKSENA